MYRILFINDGVIARIGLFQMLEENLPFDYSLHMISDSVEWTAKDQFNLIIIGSITNNISELVRKIKANNHQTRVLIFANIQYDDAINALKAGAHGFLDQRAEIEEIVLAVTTLIIGKRYWGRQFVKDMAQHTLKGNDKHEKISTLIQLHRLSKRQIDVLRALIFGESIASIALNFGLSPSTVATHKQLAFKKLGITDIVQLVEGFYADTNSLNQQV